MTIWAIVSGSYSDYSVDAVFEDQATAQAWLDALGNDDDETRLAEFTFVPSNIVPEVETTYHALCKVERGGGVRDEYARTSRTLIYPDSTTRNEPVRSAVFGKELRYVNVYGTDQERVQKVYSEKKAMCIANPNYSE